MRWFDNTTYVQPNERTMAALKKASPEDFLDRAGPLWKVKARDAPFSWWRMGFSLGAEWHWKN